MATAVITAEEACMHTCVIFSTLTGSTASESTKDMRSTEIASGREQPAMVEPVKCDVIVICFTLECG